MVDHRGYAPRLIGVGPYHPTNGCKPADFLNNLVARKWHGDSVLPRACLVLEAELRCWRPPLTLVFEIGAVSRLAGDGDPALVNAPASSDWQSDILLWKDDHKKGRVLLNPPRKLISRLHFTFQKT